MYVLSPPFMHSAHSMQTQSSIYNNFYVSTIFRGKMWPSYLVLAFKFCKMVTFQCKICPMVQIWWTSPRSQHDCIQRPLQ